MKRLLQTAAIAAASVLTVGAAQAADPIKIGHVVGLSGPLEPYAKQLQNGLEMGIEYATDGTNEVLGRKIEIITKDTQLKPDRARALLEEAYADDASTNFAFHNPAGMARLHGHQVSLGAGLL